MATAPGTAHPVPNNGNGYGNYVWIDHDNGLYSLYGHLQSFSVVDGQFVGQGQQIALSDNTGNSSGPHLHFKISKGSLTGAAYKPEPMSGVTGFGSYGYALPSCTWHGSPNFTSTPSPHYKPFAADFNSDGFADIGVRDAVNGTFYIKHGLNFTDQVTGAFAPHGNYQPFAEDMNRDGFADIGLRDANTGYFYWKLEPSFATQIQVNWSAAGYNYEPFACDLNHDGSTDIGVRDSNSGTWYFKHGPGFSDQTTYSWAAGAHYESFVGDFNADGYCDIGLRDPNNGVMYLKYGPSYSGGSQYTWAPCYHYQPYSGDFNADFYGELGLRDPNAGLFFWRYGPSFSSQSQYPTSGWWAAEQQIALGCGS